MFCIALLALVVLRDDERQPADNAPAVALDTPAVRSHLAQHGFDRVVSARLDDETTRVAFFDGPRIVLEAAVPARGEVRHLKRYERGKAVLGSDVGQTAPVLPLILVAFALATLRAPLRRIENLDAAALAAFALPIVLLNERYMEWSALSSSVLLAYLVWRCVSVAVRGRDLQPQRFVVARVRPVHVGAAVVALLMLAIPGGLVSDVGFASMAGATRVLDGGVPYGTLDVSELVHGDTYPLLAYLAYVPAALIAPVRGGFDNLDPALWVATGFALVAAAALARVAGSRMALAFLAFPPVMVAASSGSNDTVAAALVSIALALGSTAALTAAGWVKLAPLALVPLWVAAARRRGMALVGAAAVTLATAAGLVALGGPVALADFFHAVSFQAERGSLFSPWAVLGQGAQMVFQAAVIAGLVAACVHVWRDRALAADPRRMAALGAAILLAVQLAANYWSYTYLAWVFPLLAVALLADATPSRPPAPSA